MKSFANNADYFYESFVEPKPGLALVVGSRVYEGRKDRRDLFDEAFGIDMVDGEGVDLVHNLENRLPRNIGKFSHIDCCSVLEHSRRPWLLAANLERLLEPAGTIFVSVPFVWRIHAYPDDYWRLTPSGLRSLFPQIEWASVQIASNQLSSKRRIEAIRVGNYPFMARAETVGFGCRL